MGIYSVGVKGVNQIVQSGRIECLAGRPYPRDTRKTQLSLSVLTLRILVMCKTHTSFRGMLSREIPAKILLTSIALVFTLSLTITQLLQ